MFATQEGLDFVQRDEGGCEHAYGWAFRQIRFIGRVCREAKDLKNGVPENPKPCVPSENLHKVPRHVGPSL